MRQRYRREFLDAIQAQAPVYIVVGSLPELILGKQFRLTDFPELEEIVDQFYQKEIQFGPLELYRRKENVNLTLTPRN